MQNQTTWKDSISESFVSTKQRSVAARRVRRTTGN